MNSLKECWFRPAAAVLGLALFSVAGIRSEAQEANPSTRAARLSYVQGDVQIAQGTQMIADPALANTPLFAGTVVTTKEDGQAEIQFDDGTIARISPNSSLKLTVLDQQAGAEHTEIQVDNGLAYVEMSGETSTDRVIARFDGSAITATGYTVLRINMDNPPGEVAVFTGNAHLERGSGLSLDLRGGESVALNASDTNQYNLAETIEPNSWDAWNADRDQELSSEQAAKTAASGSQPNSNNPAWGDLDANGDWYNVPGEGYVWSPYEASTGDWDPYGYGNWVWNPGYGYSWVSGYPWGYLPYTCGYWNYYDGFGWGWTPGYGYPWWATGGWVINIGTRPFRYDPPHRPHGGPVHPPIHGGGFYQAPPVIAVNRIPHMPTAHPVHPVGAPARIAGTTVEPMRPLSPRPVYNHTTAAGFGNAFQGGGANSGFGRPGAPAASAPGHYIPWANSPAVNSRPSRPGTWTMPASPGTIYRPAPPSVYRGPAAAPSHPSYSGGAPHVSSGGGGGGRMSGGGGVHPSGGGGGHASSGGGGHH